jgi:hypothetical protein
VASHPSQQYRSARSAGHNGISDPRFDEQGGTRLAGAIGFGRHHHHHHGSVRLVLYPGEEPRTFVVSRKGKHIALAGTGYETTIGHVYVVGGRGEAYEAVGGPPPGEKGPGGKGGHTGGHTAAHTPSGLFTLGPQEHHTSLNWPFSSIPYGAKLSLGGDGLVHYFEHGVWKKANGPDGTWSKATRHFNAKSGEPAVVTEGQLADFHIAAYTRKGDLRPHWIMNDFGEWSWNLMRNGVRTAYYVHTTPEDEYFKRAPLEDDVVIALLGQSHGCVHLLPRDRDEMMQRGYLKAGIHVQIMPYKRKGPPKGWLGPSKLHGA